jgi:hypothetical protein
VIKQKDGRRNRYQIQVHLPLPEAARHEPAIGAVLAVLAGRPRLSPGRFFTPRTLLNLGHLRPHGRRDGRHVASPRDHLRRPRRPVPLQPDLPADAVPLTLSKGVVMGWGLQIFSPSAKAGEGLDRSPVMSSFRSSITAGGNRSSRTPGSACRVPGRSSRSSGLATARRLNAARI